MSNTLYVTHHVMSFVVIIRILFSAAVKFSMMTILVREYLKPFRSLRAWHRVTLVVVLEGRERIIRSPLPHKYKQLLC